MAKNDQPSSDPKIAAEQILAAIKAECGPELQELAEARAALAEFEGVAGVATGRASGLRAKVRALKAKVANAVASNEDPLPAARELRDTASDLDALEGLVPAVHAQRLSELKQAATDAEEALYKAAVLALQNSPTRDSYEQAFTSHLVAAVTLRDGFLEGLSLASRELGFMHHNLNRQHPVNHLRCTDYAVGRALPGIPVIR